jgi:tRNA (guanosine-2'-O-)-methyltransferase
MPDAHTMTTVSEKDRMLFQHLSQFVSDHKKEFVDHVLSKRTRHITIVLEDIYQSQNASAVVRTCECMGLQDIHIVEQESKYEINRRVLKGANKWMNLYRYHNRSEHNIKKCFDALRADGYKILVTDPSPDGTSIYDVDVEASKLALVFGNELRGISDYALTHADEKVRIPMHGFTESLNISVSVAICLSTLIKKIHRSEKNFFLTDAEKDTIKLAWYRKIVRRSDLIEREFLRAIQ